MILKDLDGLSRDENQENLYNLFSVTFQSVNIGVKYVIVDKFEEMRIDQVAKRIYSSTRNIDFLLNINSIDNPLNIMEGDIIVYVDESQIDLFKSVIIEDKEVKNQLVNISKVRRTDGNRTKYVENNYQLAPTYLETPTNSVKIEGNKIIIGDVK